MGSFQQGSLFEVVLGNVSEEFADDLDGVFAVFGGKVAYAALLRVYAELVEKSCGRSRRASQ